MNEERTAELLELEGYKVESISLIPEGRSHYNFEVEIPLGEVVAKFEREGRERGTPIITAY